jgi:hypothetical protein
VRRWPDRAAAAEPVRRRRGSGVGAVSDGGIDDGGSGAVWEASAGDDQTERFDLLTT